MEKYILRPIETFEQDGMKLFSQKLENNSRLYILSGKPSVGKTAFCFKILYYQKLQNNFTNILFIYFDKTIEYWKQKFSIQDPESLKNIKFNKMKISNFHKLKSEILDQMEEFNYHLIFIDGIYSCGEFQEVKMYTSLLLDLMDMAHALQKPIILTARQNKPVLIPNIITHAHRPLLPETWFIERPDYLNGEIKKFGDNRILVF